MDPQAKFARQQRMNLLIHKRRRVNVLMSPSGPENGSPQCNISRFGDKQKCSITRTTHVGYSPLSQFTNSHLHEASDVQVQASDASAAEP
ncbi:hypothetical protein S245_039864, partial [Arachis hypogaea]